MAEPTTRLYGATAAGVPVIRERPSARGRQAELAARGSAIASAVLLVSALLPWLSVTFFSAATLSGIRVWEGKVALILAFIAGGLSLALLYIDGINETNRRSITTGTVVCGILSFLVTLIFSFRFHDALAIPPVLGSTGATALANAGVGLESGWYLAMLSSLALIGTSVWNYLHLPTHHPHPEPEPEH